MLHDHPRPPSQPFDPDNSATGERDLAAELARIMARPPRRAGGTAVPHPGGGKLAKTASDEATGPLGQTDALTDASEADTSEVMEDTAPMAPMPVWARARRSRRFAHNARMVVASIIAVAVVFAIIGGTAVALFGASRDFAQLRQLLLPVADRGPTSAR